MLQMALNGTLFFFHMAYYEVVDGNGVIKVLDAYLFIKSVGHPLRGKLNGPPKVVLGNSDFHFSY